MALPTALATSGSDRASGPIDNAPALDHLPPVQAVVGGLLSSDGGQQLRGRTWGELFQQQEQTRHQFVEIALIVFKGFDQRVGRRLSSSGFVDTTQGSPRRADPGPSSGAAAGHRFRQWRRLAPPGIKPCLCRDMEQVARQQCVDIRATVQQVPGS